MDGLQGALLYWKQMLYELGDTSNKHHTGSKFEKATRRSDALVELWFSLLDVVGTETLFEIGAHNAESSRRFVASNDGRNAFAFEANPSVYQNLLSNLANPRLIAINKAVGLENGTIEFFAPEPGFEYLGSTRKRADFDRTSKIDVEMVTLDSASKLLVNESLARNVGLWIDVEGCALDVLLSGTTLLHNKVSMIYAELNDGATYAGSDTSLQVFATLLDLGFVPLARDNEWPDAWNACFMHSSLLTKTNSILTGWLQNEMNNNLVSK